MMKNEPYSVGTQKNAHRKRQHKATDDDIDLSQLVELVVLSIRERAARCRLSGSDRVITFRRKITWDMVPGEIVTIKPRKKWRYAGHPYLSGNVESTRLDVTIAIVFNIAYVKIRPPTTRCKQTMRF